MARRIKRGDQLETIAEKLQYTSNAVDDIQAAINEKGVDVDNTVGLGYYGAKIREIKGGLTNFQDYYETEKFDSFSKLDIMPKTISDASDLVITGNLDNLDTLDCLTLGSFEAFAPKDISAKDIEDVSSNYSF